MDIKKEDEEKLINFGVFGYDAKKISNILDYSFDEVNEDFNNTNSNLFKLLQKGRDMSDYIIDLKLFDMAKSGDIKALEKLELRKRNRK